MPQPSLICHPDAICTPSSIFRMLLKVISFEMVANPPRAADLFATLLSDVDAAAAAVTDGCPPAHHLASALPAPTCTSPECKARWLQEGLASLPASELRSELLAFVVANLCPCGSSLPTPTTAAAPSAPARTATQPEAAYPEPETTAQEQTSPAVPAAATTTAPQHYTPLETGQQAAVRRRSSVGLALLLEDADTCLPQTGSFSQVTRPAASRMHSWQLRSPSGGRQGWGSRAPLGPAVRTGPHPSPQLPPCLKCLFCQASLLVLENMVLSVILVTPCLLQSLLVLPSCHARS